MNTNAFIVFFLLYTVVASTAVAQSPETMSGLQIMEEVQRRHLLDVSIYEEWSMIMTDSMGNRDTRNLRRYSKVDDTGDMKYLLLLDTPTDIHGVALLSSRDETGNRESMIYLPAYGGTIGYVQHGHKDNNILGMDFSLEDLSGEALRDYLYVRREGGKTANVDYLIVDVYPPSANTGLDHPIKRHHIREDGFMLMRTEYFDKQRRLFKQMTLHDIHKHDAGRWSAGMILMENIHENHNTLIKVTRRVVSADYVPAEVFTLDWLYQNQPVLQEETGTGNYEIAPARTENLALHYQQPSDRITGCPDQC